VVDSLTFSATATVAATATTAAAQPPVLDFATPPPAAALAASGAIAATVAGVEAGILQLNTVFGPILLRTNLIPPPGAAVEVTIVPGSQAGASVVFTSGSPTSAATPRPAAVPGADPTEVVELGQTVQATVLASGASSNIAVGSTLSLRITPLEISTGAQVMPATVGESTDGTTVLESTLGRLALDANLELPSGTQVNIEPLDSAPSATASLPNTAGLGNGWPALDDALAALDRAAPEIATRMRSDLTPTTAPRLAATLLYLAGSLKSAGAFPPETAAAALSVLGRRDLAQRIEKDVGEFRRLAETNGGDWRILTLPVLDEHAVQPIRLYLRPADDDEDAARRNAGGSRFVLDLEMSRLGALQLDGLVRSNRFDLMMRSHAPLPPAFQSDVAAIFNNALEGAGLHGNISFSTTPHFPVAPLAALRPRIGVEV